MNEKTLIGYHGTLKKKVKDILQNGFEPSISKENELEWLGDGIYFWEDDYYAVQWNIIDIERKHLTKNIENFNLTNVEVVKAYAPVELDIYNDVDAIFLGGTGNKLEEIIDWSKDLLVPGGRLVANFIIIDTFYEMLRLVREKGFKNVDVTVLNVSKLEKLGPGEYFKPHNPIYIISCEKGVE